MAAWIVETTHGSEVIPDGFVSEARVDLMSDYCEGRVVDLGDGEADARFVEGWFCRLSAPGYMDCTDWSGPFRTQVDARLYLADTYDIDPYNGEDADANE